MTTARKETNGCGGKHLKLGLSLIAVFVSVVLAITSYTMGRANGHDVRIRAVEQKTAMQKAQFEEILRRLDRIESKVEKKERPE